MYMHLVHEWPSYLSNHICYLYCFETFNRFQILINKSQLNLPTSIKMTFGSAYLLISSIHLSKVRNDFGFVRSKTTRAAAAPR